MAPVTFLYGNDETEFLKKVNFVKLPIRRDETGENRPHVEINVGVSIFITG